MPTKTAIRNREKSVLIDTQALRECPEGALIDGVTSLEPGQILVYEVGPVSPFEYARDERIGIRRCAANVADRLGAALVQWPNTPAGTDGPRTWCWGIQKPTR